MVGDRVKYRTAIGTVVERGFKSKIPFVAVEFNTPVKFKKTFRGKHDIENLKRI